MDVVQYLVENGADAISNNKDHIVQYILDLNINSDDVIYNMTNLDTGKLYGPSIKIRTMLKNYKQKVLTKGIKF